MKKATILILIILTVLSTINGVEWCGIKRGLYLDVKTSAYKLYKPIETITNNYIQIDSNKDFELFMPDWVKVNAEMMQACTMAMQTDKTLICD